MNNDGPGQHSCPDIEFCYLGLNCLAMSISESWHSEFGDRLTATGDKLIADRAQLIAGHPMVTSLRRIQIPLCMSDILRRMAPFINPNINRRAGDNSTHAG